MTKNIMVLGADGMLGHKVVQFLNEAGYGGVLSTRDDTGRALCKKFTNFGPVYFDARFTTDLNSFLWLHKPDVIINCIGLLKQRKGQTEDIILNTQVNAMLPHLLAQSMDICFGKKCRLITFSSDCVFRGDKFAPYSKEDIPDAISVYGRTKALGEIDNNDKVLTLRTSFIGREIKNHYSLLEWALSQKGKEVNGYTEALWSGVTSNYIAYILPIIIENFCSRGLFHITSASPISKFTLLYLLDKHYKLGLKLKPDSKFALDRVCDRRMYGEEFSFSLGLYPNWKDDLFTNEKYGLLNDKFDYEEWQC